MNAFERLNHAQDLFSAGRFETALNACGGTGISECELPGRLMCDLQIRLLRS